MHIFFSDQDLHRMKATAKSAPWPDFNDDFLTQKASSFIDPSGEFQYEVLRFDGNSFNRISTSDTKFASWIVSESSMAYAMGLGQKYFDSALAWVSAMIAAPVWSSSPQLHIDLDYGNFAYACAFFLDLCGERCDQTFIAKLENRMLQEIRIGAKRFSQRPLSLHPYTQNHFYIPFTGYLCMCAALKHRNQECAMRLEEAKPFIPLIFDGLGEDGWYYEGLNYFHYAFIWLIRLAMLAEQHWGPDHDKMKFFPGMSEYLKWTLFPKGRSFFNIGDSSSKKWNFDSWEEASHVDSDNWNDTWSHNYSHIAKWIAGKTGDPACAAIADNVKKQGGFRWNEGFWALLWGGAANSGAETEKFHLFKDFGVWASDTSDQHGNILRVLAKCGPPMGHSLKLDASGNPAYSYNAGHVHPDAGSVFAAWNDLPVILGPGYLGRKAGTYLNSLTIDGLGQQEDRLYHALNREVVDYAKLKKLSVRGNASGVKMDFAEAYRENQGVLVASRKIDIVSAESFEISDEVELLHSGRIEARFRVSDPPVPVEKNACEWGVSGTLMRFELLECSCQASLWILPGMVTTINDGKTNGSLEAGLSCQRGYQILIKTDCKERAARWRVRFEIIGFKKNG